MAKIITLPFRLFAIIPLVALATACTEATRQPTDALSLTDKSATAVETAATVTVSPADLQFGEGASTPVISTAQKFIIPVPALENGGEPLVYPPDDHRAGAPIVDYKGEPIGERGLVFFNQADQTVQAVAGDGNGVVILNQVTADQANALHQYILELNPDPASLTLAQLKQVLAFAQQELDLGDMYNSDRTFITENMSPIETWTAVTASDQADPAYGLKKRDDRDINQAIYIPGSFQFEGPAATPQVFENGGVIVQQQDDVRGVQPEIFIHTYSFSNGQPIANVSDLATQNPF